VAAGDASCVATGGTGGATGAGSCTATPGLAADDEAAVAALAAAVPVV